MFGGEEETAGSFGENRFAEKQAALQDDKNNSMDLEKAQQLGKELASELSREFSNAGKVFAESLVPPFIKRFMNRKVYGDMVEKVESKQDAFLKDVNRAVRKQKADRKVEKKERKDLKQRNRQASILATETNKELEAARRAREEAIHQDYQDRRDKQLAQVQAEIDSHVAEMKRKIEQEVLAKRAYNLEHWTQQSRTLHDEAVANSQAKRDWERNKARENVDAAYEDWGERELTRAKTQVIASLNSPVVGEKRVGGLFATSPSRLSRNNELELEDVGEVHLFDSADTDARYETASTNLQLAAAEEQRSRQLFDALQEQHRDYGDAITRMLAMVAGYERDSAQMKAELQEMEVKIMGPPRRLPMPQEVKPMHIRKERLSQLKRQMDELRYCVSLAEKRQDTTKTQMQQIAASLSAQEEANRPRQLALTTENGQLGMLPVVIGRSIAKLGPESGLDVLRAKPLETFNAITQQSKFVATRELVKYAMKTHKERNKLDQELWVNKQNSTGVKIETNLVVSRLADIANRMKSAFIETMKANIIDAIFAFQQSGVQLRHVVAKESGFMPWYNNMDEEASENVVCYTSQSVMGDLVFEIDESGSSGSGEAQAAASDMLSNGVMLGQGRSGHCVGHIPMPKLALWNIMMSASVQGGVPSDTSYETVSIFLGSDMGSLVPVGTFDNKTNPETGAVLYDVVHPLRSDSVAFRFEFTSTSGAEGGHMCVAVGFYEQFEMKPLEVLQDPKGTSTRERVLSSFVKTLRIDEKQGKFRETQLLEELVALEGSTADFWDSALVSHTPQRFSREYYLRILKVEILLQQKSGNAAIALANEKRAKAKAARARLLLSKKEEKVEASKTDFMMRKRQRQSNIIDVGQALVRTRIEIFDPSAGAWRHVIVKSCVVRWMDNGLTAKCTHMLHEHNEGNELLGAEFEVDLSRVRWFEAAVQDVDEDAMEKWRRQRGYEKRLQEIARSTERQIYEMRATYDSYRHGEEAALRKQVHRISKRLDTNVIRLALLRAEEHDAQRTIRHGTNSVLLEMKMGIIKLQADVKPGTQAYEISKERFVAAWIAEKRRQTMDELLEMERGVEQRINIRRVEFMQLEAQVLAEANKERYGMLSEIREHRRVEKEKLMAKVKIDPKAFELALPRARVCAHLKTKAWGDKYSKGIRCTSCGKELSEIHKEESQMLGYGTATDDWMYAAIKRHRENEASFRFKNASELRIVEDERMHLEKERRVMEESEAFFYDFQDLSAVYDFDRRHAPFIKKGGIFRQGLQWTEEELRAFERDAVHAEKQRITRENLVENVIDKFDPLDCIEEPPPTFRAADERRKAQYDEFMFMMGRLSTFQKKVALLKEQRLELMADRRVYSAVVVALHKESYAFDTELEGIEADLDRTGMLLSTYDRMQKLWRQATRILQQADRDKRKAEMRFCGVWEDVTEAKEKLSWVHDETLELLKIKFLYDSAVGNKHLVLRDEQAMLAEKTKKMEESVAAAFALEYCRPGDPIMTRYGGYGWIRMFRKRDGMLFCTLSFATPAAKIWTRADEWVAAERARQQGERFLMEIEDRTAMVCQRADKKAMRREQLSMQSAELGLRDYYTFVDLGLRQDAVVRKGVEAAVQDQYAQLGGAAFKRQQDKLLTRKVRVWFERERESYEDYVGPSAGRPKKPNMWRQYQYRKELNAELQTRFLATAAVEAEKTTLSAFYKVRTQWLQTYAFSQLIDAAVVEWVKEIALETYNEGKTAKRNAERMSGIAFPNPRTMQFNVYRSLVDIWKRRKVELRLRVDANKGFAAAVTKATTKAEQTTEQLLAAKAARRVVRIEKRRQKALQDVLAAEEAMTRAFVRWELTQNLMERRQMAQEERDGRAYAKALDKAQRAAKDAKVKAGSSVAQLSVANSMEERRQQLKELTLERRRREEDQAFMILEDKAGETLRDIDRRERQKAQLAKALGVKALEEAEAHLGEAGAGAPVLNEFEVEIPAWMNSVPLDWDTWSLLKQRQHVDEAFKVRERALAIANNAAVDDKKMDKVEVKGYDEWRSLYAVASVEAAELELTVMTLAEKTRGIEYDLVELEANIRRVATFVREKGEEELRMQSFVSKKEQYARKRERELKEATAWHELCIKRSRQRDKVKRRVAANCLWIDTDTITGFHQRFETFRLRERLYYMYFRRIAAQIICRAEIIASERRLFSTQEQLSVNKATLLERTSQMKERWKEIQRDDYLRMRKSLLNAKFFPRHRHEVLKQRFSGWVRFYLWNRGHREAFELRYEVLRTQMDLQRQFKQQLMPPEEAVVKPPRAPQTIASVEEGITPMQRHREHPLQCAVCKLFYLDAANHSLACSYHPGLLQMDCPRSCPSPGFTSLCQSHRIRRWKCCDSIKADSAGCARRNHVPAETDAIYEKMMSRVRQRDLDESLSLDNKLDAIRKNNWPLQMMVEKRGQVGKIEDAIKVKRDKADLFSSLKFA